MRDELIYDVGKLIQEKRNYIPTGYKLWKAQSPQKLGSVDNLFRFLLNLFKEEERAIEIEQKYTSKAERYENGVRIFAVALVKRLMRDHKYVNGMASYMNLLGQRHMAYAFYHVANTENSKLYDSVAEDIKYTQRLYQGLINFYRGFYGTFQDNEEAICLICKYYPKESDSWLKQKDVINALYDHIKIAGSIVNFGYAYHGIEYIQKYIHGLPDELIIGLLNEYHLYDVLNQSIYRHQIFAIINGSELADEKKRDLKFFYIDSLLLANIFNIVWTEKERKRNKKAKVYYNSYEKKLNEEPIQVLKEPEAYWNSKYLQERMFWVDGYQIATITAGQNRTVFSFLGNKEDFPFSYDDWALEGFRTGQVQGMIKRLISEDGDGELHKEPMTFSLLYLDGYRGIKERTLDFDHRFMFVSDNRELKHREKERNLGVHFYGESVYSLSCIVGKNGTGKTSVVDFLRDIFYKILKIMEDFEIPCKEGYVALKDFAKYKIIDEPITFLVVFRFGNKDYFLTNIADISSTGVLPYQIGICHNIYFCKVAYFSQQFMANQAIRMENGQEIKREDVSGISRTLEGLGQCDYSETKSFLLRKNAMELLHNSEEEGTPSRDFCYLLSFLRHIGIETFCKDIGIPPERELTIYSLKSGKTLKRFTLKECEDISKIKELEEQYACMPDVGLGFFSSGQYAKFMFLAKLRWFLKGYHEDSEYYKDMFGRQFFPMEDALQRDETALIFIDEGEVYYHPEWQRRYLSTLLDMLCLAEGKARIQVVFTTNSPFVISDMLKEDIQYLSDERNEIGDTLGQNIHKLLIKNFFMDYTIGEYSRKLIETLICQLTDEKRIKSENAMDIYNYFDNTQDKYNMMEFLIQQIGEPIYRNKLEKMLERRMESEEDTKESRIRELERQKEDLEKKLAELKGETNDTD